MFFFKKHISICAIVGARNESNYLKILFPLLAEQGIDIAVVDNGSTDGSLELYSSFAGKPVVKVQHLPYPGFVSMSSILSAKQDICKEIKHDWVIHHDADEIMEHYKPGKTLRHAIEEAHKAGYNALNFDEFVFLPEPDSDYSNRNHYKELLRYYFFEPRKNRLNRAWKRNAKLIQISGGHQLKGNSLSIAPENHIMRHYITLNQQHLIQKYLNRIYDEKEIARGQHYNRLNFTEAALKLPTSSDFIFQLEKYNSREFHRDHPTKKHFWEW